MSNAPVLDVIILNWNGAAYCVALLSSIARTCADQIGATIEVVVVDNASTDDSCTLIAEKFPWVRVVRNARNLGFAAGNNAGIRATRSPYVMLLNNDTEITDGAVFGKLVSVLRDNDDVAAVSPALLLRDGTPQTGVGGHFLTIRSALGYFLFLSRAFPRIFPPYFIRQADHADAAQNVELEWLTGAALAMRRDVLERVGGIPEQYFMYSEDVQLSRAFRDEGFRVLYVPTVSVMHRHGGSAGAAEIDTRWVWTALDEYAGRGGRLGALVVQLIMTVGFSLRMAVYGIRSLGTSAEASFKRRAMGRYAKAAGSYCREK